MDFQFFFWFLVPGNFSHEQECPVGVGSFKKSLKDLTFDLWIMYSLTLVEKNKNNEYIFF